MRRTRSAVRATHRAAESARSGFSRSRAATPGHPKAPLGSGAKTATVAPARSRSRASVRTKCPAGSPSRDGQLVVTSATRRRTRPEYSMCRRALSIHPVTVLQPREERVLVRVVAVGAVNVRVRLVEVGRGLCDLGLGGLPERLDVDVVAQGDSCAGMVRVDEGVVVVDLDDAELDLAPVGGLGDELVALGDGRGIGELGTV